MVQWVKSIKLPYFISTVTDRVSVSVFASLVCLPVGITSLAVGIKICAITARIVSISQL